jgi:hypothetical protein
MKLEEVLPALREGKKIRRAYWPKGIYLTTVGDDVREIDEFDDTPPNWWFTTSDLIEEDWEVIG